MKQQRQYENKGKSKTLFLLFFFLLSLGCIIFGVWCLCDIRKQFVQNNFLTLSIVVGAVACILFVMSVCCVFYEKWIVVKAMISVYVLLLFFLILCWILLKTGFFKVVDSPEKLQQYLEKAGVWMPILYMILQFLQVVVLPIPSVVSTVAGVALFGAFWAMIYSLTGILLGSLTAFFIGRKLGNKAVGWMVGKETLLKWQKKLKGKDNLFLTLMFILPLFPDDILCFIAGLSTMTTKYFLIAILLSRAVGIFATCYSIDFIPFNTWWGITVWLLLAVGIAFVFVLVYRNMDKLQEVFKRLLQKRKTKK